MPALWWEKRRNAVEWSTAAACKTILATEDGSGERSESVLLCKIGGYVETSGFVSFPGRLACDGADAGAPSVHSHRLPHRVFLGRVNALLLFCLLASRRHHQCAARVAVRQFLPLPIVAFKRSAESLLSTKTPSLVLVVRAVNATSGAPLDSLITPAASSPFTVATKRVRSTMKSHIPSMDQEARFPPRRGSSPVRAFAL